MKRPLWIGIGIVVLMTVVVALSVRSPATLARSEFEQAKRAFESRDIDRAAELSASAARRVPENAEYANLSRYYSGVRFVAQRKYADAIRVLESVRGPLRNERIFRFMLLGSKANEAFDHRDFDAYLQHALELYELDPQDRQATTGLASAYSCKWVITGDDQWKTKAEALLTRAEALPPSKGAERMVRRIRHRFETKTILTDDEYDRMFAD